MGWLPDLTTFPSLRELWLAKNHLNWTIPISLGNLSNLEFLYLEDNALEGVISETHFSNLTKLKGLGLANTLLVFNINFDWVPPFQLKMIGLLSSQVGRRFPKWFQTQKNLSYLDISNSKISDTLSNSDWIFSSQLLVLNLSHNQINGQVPNFSLEFLFFPEIDLSFNNLEVKYQDFYLKRHSWIFQRICFQSKSDPYVQSLMETLTF